jgi:acetyl esterase
MALHPEIKKMLDNFKAMNLAEFNELTPDEVRSRGLAMAQARVFPHELPPLKISDHQIPTTDGTNILGRLYQPKIITTKSLIIFYHGGGYVFGNVETHDKTCRWLATVLETPIISIDYRLAPEYPFPTPIEDGYDALVWIAKNAEKIGVPYKKLVVSGDSAGGNLATMVSLLARDRHDPKIDLQFLIYPWISSNFDTSSYRQYATDHLLTKKDCIYFTELYMKNSAPANYSAFPLEDADLKNLPPAMVIVAECDVLHDEGLAYAEKLRTAGNTVYEYEAEGMIHGFLNQFPIPASYNAVQDILAKLQPLLQ